MVPNLSEPVDDVGDGRMHEATIKSVHVRLRRQGKPKNGVGTPNMWLDIYNVAVLSPAFGPSIMHNYSQGLVSGSSPRSVVHCSSLTPCYH
jgi:hypothetical protein